ncbi:putative MFS-type transporter YdgK [Symbiodinium microadriaticum]|uniref:Putative MFS-type transporter YdgK n=1 Tax=Symbiodinium microadriaticum TaxID=2951 RepID=A0A1Q9E1X5_SYMMI|nr:putative MFS-type transporter YdgK [Symbiodinium microadriaticum]
MAFAEYCDVLSFLQVDLQVARLRESFLVEKAAEQLPLLARAAQYLVSATYACLLLLSAGLLICGLPRRAPQDASEQKTCPASWIVFLGIIYTFTYFTTDQYVPSLPQMKVDLAATQSLMSLTVQMNFIVKALFGLLAASLSDRIGRRPVLLFCLVLLSLASFCCACAGRIEWFFAARVLQGIGESVEPVLFAIVRDYFADPRERFGIVSVLQVMSIGGMLVAPCAGGLLAELSGWRTSFFILAVIWGLLATYAWWTMVESCGEGESASYLKDLSRILDPHLLCLLLTQSCIMGGCLTFNANSSYFTQVTLGGSVMMSAFVMLTFGACNSLGALVTGNCCTGSIFKVSKISLTLLLLAGVISILLEELFPSFLWGYLVGSFLQAAVMTMALVSVNVLFFEPLDDCAGMAASCEIFAKSVVPSLFSMVCTQAMIHQGVRCFVNLQAAACVAAGLVFWLGYARNPPAWLVERDAKLLVEFPDAKDEGISDGASPVYAAAMKVLEALLDARANADTTKDDGASAAFIATQFGSPKALSLLLGASADPNRARQEDGVAPAYMAVQSGHSEELKMLLEDSVFPAEVRGVTWDHSFPQLLL